MAKEIKSKKNLLILGFVLIVQLLPAQSLVTEPSVQSDIMTYFQAEMASLIRFQREQNRIKPFFCSFLVQAAGIGKDQDLLSNSTFNFLLGYLIKLGNHWYIPLYYAGIAQNVIGYPDGWVDHNYPLSTIRLTETRLNSLLGTGLYYRASIFSGGVFAAYHHKMDSTNVHVFNYSAGIDESLYNHTDTNTKDTFKLAILPGVNTSGLRYVGSILNNALGYLSMGDAVDVYNGREDDKNMDIAASIAALLNYGLNLGFRPIEWGNTSFDLNSFYRRDNYDAVARNDVYGGTATISFPFFRERVAVSFECGFRHFIDVSPYYVLKYHDTLFYNIEFELFSNALLLRAFLRYDDVTKWCFGITANLTDTAGSISMGVGNGYITANLGIRGYMDFFGNIGNKRNKR